VAAKTAHEVVYVSEFLKTQEGLPSIPAKVIYNCLSDEFVKEAKSETPLSTKITPFRVLMLCSLKKYKGVMEFVNLAQKIPNLAFDLVLNATTEEIVVISGFNGYLIDQREEKELILKIKKIASDKKFYQKLSYNSSKFVHKFSKEKVEGRILDLVKI